MSTATVIRMTNAGFRAAARGGTLLCDRFRIVETDRLSGDYYWRERMNGYTSSADEAGIYTVNECLTLASTSLHFEFVPPAAPSPLPPRILLTLKQAKTYRDQIQNKMCRWVPTYSMSTWAKRPLPSGLTANIEEAQEFQIKTILNEYHTSHSSILIDMLDQEEAERISKLPVKLCILEDSLPDSMIQSLKAQPTNPVYRGLILAKCGKMPPDEIVEFDKLKDWIEYNCEPKEVVVPAAARPTPAQAQPTFIIPLNYRETECGRCNYSIQRSGSGDYQFEAGDLREMAGNHDNVDELLEEIEDVINDRAWDNAPQLDGNDYEYDRYDSTDTEDSEWEYQDSPARRRENLVRFLRTTLSPAQLERLGIPQQAP